MSLPETEYQTRLSARRKHLDHEQGRYARLGTGRLLFVISAICLLMFAGSKGVSLWLPGLAAVAILVALLVVGDRFDQRIRWVKRAVQYYERALDRVRNRRNEAGEMGERFLTPDHPYAIDLDLFGKHSLFQVLSVCRTRGGEALLAQWLLTPANQEEIESRHEALAEMRPLLDLREDLAVLSEDFGGRSADGIKGGVKPEALAEWAVADPIAIPGALRICAAVLSLTGLVVLAAWTLTLFGDSRLRAAVIIVALIEGAIFFRWREVVEQIARAADGPGNDLALLRAVLARLEQETFVSSRLVCLRAALEHPRKASQSIASLKRLIELLESRENWLIRAIGPVILWTTQVSFAVEAWRQRYGNAIPAWLDASAEFEALSSLAAASYEHPEDALPEVVDSPAPLFHAQNLSHPLLSHCVPNDVSIGHDRPLLIVSGSNMSGKSTLLRTVGANAVLALAGAPVRATAMRISVLSVGASIRTSDSLEGGISRFYAEILRIRQILDLCPPVLFLLDELLAGTNSHDRRIGAEAILTGLLDRGAIGFASTHDLALSAIAESLSRSGNVHFQDFIQDGRIHFDYRMRPGVVQRSNALELMRSVGLNV